ncbi:MAG: dihydroorotase [Elusimicrobiales bacterium]
MMLLKNGFVVDTLTGSIEKKDILIKGRIIKSIGKVSVSRSKIKKVFDLKGRFVIPALVDIHVHSRVPGKEYAEDFSTISKQALRGGIGRIVTMANTIPVADDEQTLRYIKKRAAKESLITVFQTSAITENQEGKKIVDIERNSRYALGFSDDGRWVFKSELMIEAMKRAWRCGKKVFSHPQIPFEAVLNRKMFLRRYKGIPSFTEYLAVFRDCMIAIVENIPLHLQHISTKQACQIIREAKKINPLITAETCPHYMWFSEDDVKDANFKMNPPLRKRKDVDEVIRGVMDGTIEVIASDHAPHTEIEKSLGFEKSPFGVIGLETLLPASVDKLHIEKKMPLVEVIKRLTINPSSVVGINAGFLREGSSADICVFSFSSWLYDSSFSKSKNSPFLGMRFKSKVDMTFVAGRLLYENGRLALQSI